MPLVETPERLVVVHRDKQLLADASAARLALACADAQASRGMAQIVLTGGSMGSAIIASLVASPLRNAVGWTMVEVWWGDERYLDTGDPDRNETQARDAGLDSLGLDAFRVHPMAGPDRAESTEQATGLYARELASGMRGPDPRGVSVPDFDVVMLGVGPDAHVASLFPGHPALKSQAAAVAVHNSPKPPPDRVSLTFRSLESARQVWFLVSGDDKAEAVARSLGGASREEAPAGSVHGRESTVWLVDRAAATDLR